MITKQSVLEGGKTPQEAVAALKANIQPGYQAKNAGSRVTAQTSQLGLIQTSCNGREFPSTDLTNSLFQQNQDPGQSEIQLH